MTRSRSSSKTKIPKAFIEEGKADSLGSAHALSNLFQVLPIKWMRTPKSWASRAFRVVAGSWRSIRRSISIAHDPG